MAGRLISPNPQRGPDGQTKVIAYLVHLHRNSSHSRRVAYKQEVSEVAPTKSSDNFTSHPVSFDKAFTHFPHIPVLLQYLVPMAVAPILT